MDQRLHFSSGQIFKESHSLQLQVERVLSIYRRLDPGSLFYGINRIEISMALDNLQLY